MLARLMTLMRVHPTQDESRENQAQRDGRSAILQEWELAREQASSPAELAEIDAIFGRHAA